MKKILPISILLIPTFAQAYPIDWHGSYGVDSTMVTDHRRIASKTDNSAAHPATDDGTQEVALDSGAKDTLSFQSYIFKLAPDIIINDAATVKAEFTTGYANGGFLGDSPSTSRSSDTNGSSTDVNTYYNNHAKGANLNLKKAYLELNSDTGTYEIGRHTFGWGLGALYSDGKGEWDRFASSRDGITAHYKFSNFTISPFWSQSSNTGYTRATDAKEFGTTLMYDNPQKEIAFGAYYAKKTDNAYNSFYKSSIQTANTALGSTSTKILDVYLKKIFGKFNFAVEVPMLSGDLGHVNSSTTDTSLSTKAILFQSNYQYNDSWTFGLDFGDVNGHDGTQAKYGAMFLNPNYQVSNLLFRYNMAAVANYSTQSIYDSYVTNARYFKLRSTFNSEKWVLDFAFLMAKAKEVAKSGSAAYNHTKNKIFTAAANQSDDLGKEIDFNAKYKWNKEVSINTAFGYLMTGDYYGFTNNSTSNTAKNSILLHIDTIVTF